MNSESTPYYLAVTWDRDSHPFTQIPKQQSPGITVGNSRHPFPQPPLPNDRSQVPDQKSGGVSLEDSIITDEKPSFKEEKFTYDAAWEDLHPYPLPEIPVTPEDEVEQAGNSTYDELWDYPVPEWPEYKKRFTFKVNWNPLELKRKTICILFMIAVVLALLAGMAITIFLLIERINQGDFT